MNLEAINKWLDEEYGCSYTRLEKLHDFYFKKYCDLQQENKQLQEELEWAIGIVEHNRIISKKNKEIHQLKKQLENYKKLGFKHLQDKNNNLETQQKEFIKYLEDEKDRLSGTCDIICVSKFEEADDNLQEYKRIIGYSEDE